MQKKTISKAAIQAVLRHYWAQYKKRPLATLLTFTLPAIGNIGVIYIPALVLGKIIDGIASTGRITLEGSWGYIGIFAGAFMLGEVCWRVGMHFLIKLEYEGGRELGIYSFKELVKRDYDFFTNNFVGTLTKRATTFSRGFETLSDVLSYSVFGSLISAVFAFVLLWRYSPWASIILILCLLAAFAIAIPIIKKRAALVSARHDAGSRVAGRYSDAITNVAAIKSFAKEKAELAHFGTIVGDYAEKYKRAANFQNLVYEMIMSPIYVITNAFGLIAAIVICQRFGLPPGSIVVIMAYYGNVSRNVWEFHRIYRNIENAITEAAEFTEMILEKPAVVDAPDASALRTTSARIEFRDIGFRYESSKHEARFLDGFNLKIESDQKVGLVGPSGGGKTTITKLLLRFVDVQAGQILIDGQDIGKVTQASLRSAIAYVPQEPLLFHRSLASNIAYSKDDAPLDEVKRAAALARADEFIDTLPHGYETLVGERGIKLSGGQRQRIAIARAIMKNAPILVLDEATSSLDSESERFIQEGLKELMKGKTALVIAHRLSTIRHMDRILVLDKGRIVQDGTHDELIQQADGLYAKLWSHQTGEFIS